KQVLNYVEKGNTQMGFVYETDLYTNNERTDKVNEIKKADLKKPITYEAGATSDNKFAKEWIEFLKSKKAKDILKEYHFKV
ncbi:MAG: substrate-binding domain-containing protein, partial [Staphylococcus sp.]|nr:substrate-binding domain-containing protein [Staphylococcus sp.]